MLSLFIYCHPILFNIIYYYFILSPCIHYYSLCSLKFVVTPIYQHLPHSIHLYSSKSPSLSHKSSVTTELYISGESTPIFLQSNTLSYTITGGAARHENVSAKTWRISGFADANWFWRLMVITTDLPRSYAFNKVLRPPGFLRIFFQ